MGDRLTFTSGPTDKCLHTRAGGGGYSFVAWLSHLIVDHASLSRRTTALTPNRDTTSNIRAFITLNNLLSMSPACFAFCDRHLSPRIAIVFSLLSCVLNFSISQFIRLLAAFPPAIHPVPPCTFHILPQCEFCSLLCNKGTSVHLPPPPDYWYQSSVPLLLFLVGLRPLHEIAVSAFSRIYWAM